MPELRPGAASSAVFCDANGTRRRFFAIAAVAPLKNCHHFRM
jgi:hypothetical protein